ncbi:hypothetical protein BC941DRAFT_451000 [Chlamydoabsidia padenii]|nr:hypothetical protein BC941DRAFT_451000 [Chlamydoabsidia padenii]
MGLVKWGFAATVVVVGVCVVFGKCEPKILTFKYHIRRSTKVQLTLMENHTKKKRMLGLKSKRVIAEVVESDSPGKLDDQSAQVDIEFEESDDNDDVLDEVEGVIVKPLSLVML